MFVLFLCSLEDEVGPKDAKSKESCGYSSIKLAVEMSSHKKEKDAAPENEERQPPPRLLRDFVGQSTPNELRSV